VGPIENKANITGVSAPNDSVRITFNLRLTVYTLETMSFSVIDGTIVPIRNSKKPCLPIACPVRTGLDRVLMDLIGDFVRGRDRSTSVLRQQQAVASAINDTGVSLSEITKLVRSWPVYAAGPPPADSPTPTRFPDHSGILFVYARLLETCDLQFSHDHLVELRRIANLSRKRYSEILRAKAIVGPHAVLQEALKLKEDLRNLHRAEIDFCAVLANQWRAMLQSALS
jgi:hypothetical protein